MAEKEEVMATVRIGYKTYCMPIDEAVAVIKALSRAMLYESKWRSPTEGGPTHHIYPNDDATQYELATMSADLYRMAKLAGKPKD